MTPFNKLKNIGEAERCLRKLSVESIKCSFADGKVIIRVPKVPDYITEPYLPAKLLFEGKTLQKALDELITYLAYMQTS